MTPPRQTQPSRTLCKTFASPCNVTWARFYDLKTQKPIFSGRDLVIHSSIADIERERRTGYSWYAPWGHNAARLDAKWKKQNP